MIDGRITFRNLNATRKSWGSSYYFKVEGYEAPLGYLHASFVEAMTWLSSYWKLDYQRRFLTLTGLEDSMERTEAIMETLDLAYEKGRIYGLWTETGEELLS